MNKMPANKLFKAIPYLNPEKVSQLLKTAAAHGSTFQNLLSGIQQYQTTVAQTLKIITDLKYLEQLQTFASTNLISWKTKTITAPNIVEVQEQDWGNAALVATKNSGEIYTIAVDGHPNIPGGAYLYQDNQQEAQLWYRSTCALSLFAPESRIQFDKNIHQFRYEPEMEQLVNAQKIMSHEEAHTVRTRLGYTTEKFYKTYFNPELHVLFRGPELIVDASNRSKTINSSSETVRAIRTSHRFLPKQEIFPFHYLLTSSPQLGQMKINWAEPSSVKQYEDDLRQRIAAIFDTLIINHSRRVIFGAWGCYYVTNNAHFVTKILREEIEKRVHCFDHIVFAIDAQEKDHLEKLAFFRENLKGLLLAGQEHPSESSNRLNI